MLVFRVDEDNGWREAGLKGLPETARASNIRLRHLFGRR